jgi:hypothetical protein
VDGNALVGRSRELAMLEDCLRTATGGSRGIVMITGEPGIGKTRLLDELAARTVVAGGRAVWGRTWEVGLTPAYWPWIQILGALAEPDDPAPELVGLDDRSDAASRLARFDIVGSFLIRRATAQPLAILLDDLHAADASSLLLLEYLARHVRTGRLLIAITARDGESPLEVEHALARIRRDARRIVVGRLDARDVAELVGPGVAPELARRVHELSEGNPLFVAELVACIVAHGGLEAIGQVTGLRAMIRDRVARLPDDTTHALSVAALLGREFRGRVLADVLELAHDELDRRLAPALRIGVVTRPASDRYRFSHALVAESLADEHPADEAARLHVRAAAAIERHDGDDGAHAIAHHWLEASHVDREAAVAAVERAARVALAQLGFEDAAALLERAIALCAGDRRRRATLLCARAEALQHAGRHDLGRELGDQAADLARELGDGVLLARIALARGIEFRFGETDRELVGLLREALAAMPAGDSALRARCLARLAAAEQPAYDPAAPVADARAAIAMARRIGDRRTRLDVIHVAFAALIEYVPPQELDELLRELFVLASSPGDRLIELRNRLRHCFVTLELAERTQFDATVVAFAELAESLGFARWLWPVKLVHAMVAILEGRFADARLATDEAEAIGTTAHDAQCERTLMQHRFLAAWTQTEPYGALAQRFGAALPYLRASMTVFEAQSRADIAAMRRALDQIAPMLATDYLTSAALGDAIALCHLAVPDARAAETYVRLAPLGGRVWVSSMTGFALQDIHDRVLLVLASALGEWDRIDTHGLAALAIAERLRATAWVALVRADWAAALDRRAASPAGRSDDRVRATELWADALATAVQLGMPGLVARCRAARGGDATPPVPVVEPAVRTEPDAADRITVGREGELWVVGGRGSVARVRDSRGIQMLARLIAEPGRELHVLDLVGESGGVDTGSSGEALDPKAKAAYRKRLTVLTEELEEAEAWADSIRAERARTEIEALTAELARAVGLGGRDRKVGAAVERARSNAQRRLSHAIQQLRAAAPALGDHFQRTVRTGTFCIYDPR